MNFLIFLRSHLITELRYDLVCSVNVRLWVIRRHILPRVTTTRLYLRIKFKIIILSWICDTTFIVFIKISLLKAFLFHKIPVSFFLFFVLNHLLTLVSIWSKGSVLFLLSFNKAADLNRSIKLFTYVSS